MNPVAKKSLKLVWVALWLLSLSLLALSSKAAGSAWTLTVLFAAVWAFQAGVDPLSRVPDWMRTWVWVAIIALLCTGIMVVYWRDPWSERHGEIRLLLGALAVWGCSRASFDFKPWLARAATALSLTAWMGLVWVMARGSHFLPTNPIPWAGGLGIASVWLLSMGLCHEHARGLRYFWLAGGLAAVMAVLANRTRGAVGVVLWWAMVALACWWRWWRQGRPLPGNAGRWTGFALVAAVVWVSTTPVGQHTLQRWQLAAGEVQLFRTDPEQASETSVGARLYLWSRSLELIAQSPLLGHGRATRLAEIKAWAEDAHSDALRQLGHVHNEYLHHWVDHGLPGLLSQLLYIGGLLLVARQLKRAGHPLAALSVAGVVFMHASVSLTSVNFAHNYYTSMLSLMLMLSMCMALPCTTPRKVLS